MWPSAGYSFRKRADYEKGGYPPNSHDCMPMELINDRVKEITRLNFEKVRKSRRTMARLKTEIKKTIKNFDINFVHDRIKDLPKIMNAIIEKKGNETKY